MAWDDPVVWILIVGMGILLFGSNKIPELARSLGAARREFDAASKGLVDTINSEINPIQTPARGQRPMRRAVDPTAAQQAPSQSTSAAVNQPVAANAKIISESDPLLVAAQKEGIETQGKTRTQIASELAAKVKDEPMQ